MVSLYLQSDSLHRICSFDPCGICVFLLQLKYFVFCFYLGDVKSIWGFYLSLHLFRSQWHFSSSWSFILFLSPFVLCCLLIHSMHLVCAFYCLRNPCFSQNAPASISVCPFSFTLCIWHSVAQFWWHSIMYLTFTLACCLLPLPPIESLLK